MSNYSEGKTETPQGLQAVLTGLAGASLGVLVVATLIVATAGSAIALPVVKTYFWIAAGIGGVLGLVVGIRYNKSR